MAATLDSDQQTFVEQARVGRLATADATGQPHVVPVCYAFDGRSFFIALDAKPKRVPVERLRRVRNILANPRVALVIDHYAEDWSELAFVLINGMAEIVAPGDDEHQRAIELLRTRYRQYHAMPIHDQPLIAIRPASIVSWQGDAVPP